MAPTNDRQWLDSRRVVWTAVAFLAVVVGANAFAQFVNSKLLQFDCPVFWPFSVFNSRIPTPSQTGLAAVLVAIWTLSFRFVKGSGFRLACVLGLGILAATLSNLLHGWNLGFQHPIAGGAVQEQYFHDLHWVADDPWGFLGGYPGKQRLLQTHGRTHPPGAVLLIYFMNRWLHDPGLIAAVLGWMSLAILGAAFCRLVAQDAPGARARALTMLLLVLPSVQIYGIASLDMAVAAFLTLALCLFRESHPAMWFLSGLSLFAASCMSFAAIFLPPVLLGYDLWVRRSLRPSCVVIGCAAALHLLARLVSGFNYASSFLLASAIENPAGFLLLSHPSDYVFTRLECVAEILWFLGPFTVVAAWRSMRDRDLRATAGGRLALLAICVLLAMFATGAFRTGEAARACLFVVPCLLLPLGAADGLWPSSDSAPSLLHHAAFGQTLLMQLFGFWFW